MARTTLEYESSIINSLRISDPAMNTGLGTPIRKVISAVAAEIASYSEEIDSTKTLYAIESVSGLELDALVAQFGFTRQEARAARGTITVSRDNADSALQIAYGSQFFKPSSSTSAAIYFQTTAYQELAEGVLSAEIAVTATTAGLSGNVPADTITYSTAYGNYISITNVLPTIGGRDAETDEELRKRFLETVFRNVSGTKDQYLALALAHAKNSRGNLIGRESRYSEIVQVKRSGNVLYVETSPSDETAREDNGAYEATALDMNRRFWLTLQDADTQIERAYFSTSFDTATSRYKATFKTNIGSEVFGPAAYGASFKLSHGSAHVITSIKMNSNGRSLVAGAAGDYMFDVAAGVITINPARTAENVVEGDTFTVEYRYYPVAEGDFVNMELDYLSTINRGGLKTVELYVDGTNERKVSDIQYISRANTINYTQHPDMLDRWERLDGSAPQDGHVVVPLSYQPLLHGSGSGEINIGTSLILEEGRHFRILKDITTAAGSIDAADSIELLGSFEYSASAGGYQFKFTEDPTIVIPDETPMNIPYYYNDVVDSVQSLISAQSVVTMDTRVHSARRRLFGIYLTVMYSAFPRANISELVTENVMDWASSLPFGSVIQFSDIETVAANTLGVDNVRVSLQNRDSDVKFGIVEYEADGETVKQRFVGDFKLRQNEIFDVQFVEILARSQQDW